MNRRTRRGGNAIEFALTAPVLIAMLMGIMEYGWFFSMNQGVTTAAREGARIAALSSQSTAPTNGQNAVTDELTRMGIQTSPTTNTCTVDTSVDPDIVTCEVKVTANSLTGLIPMPADYYAKVSMRIEDQS